MRRVAKRDQSENNSNQTDQETRSCNDKENLQTYTETIKLTSWWTRLKHRKWTSAGKIKENDKKAIKVLLGKTAFP